MVLIRQLQPGHESAKVQCVKKNEGITMNNKPQEPAVKSAPEPDHYMPGDPIPVPHAVEADTESVWAHFSDFAQTKEPDFADTVPASATEEQTIRAPSK